MDALVELGMVIVLTVIISGLMRLLRQPLIIGYIISGIVAGPYFLDVLQSTEVVQTFSNLGIALLLFIVGLNLSPKVIKEVGKVSTVTGIGQVLFTTLIGFAIASMLGFPTITSLYIAVALAFSSTIIIMKLLSDKGDTQTLYGKISIGFLIIQDLIAILILLVISSVPAGFDLASIMLNTLVGGIGLIALILLIGIYVLPRVTSIIAESQEFLLLFSIGWCLLLASLFHVLNFSMEIGALLAGITLSLSPYRFEISSRMRTLRDFFIVLFFIQLGSQVALTDIAPHINSIIALSIFILVGNPLIVVALMGLLGYTKRNSFFAGLTVAQISEFSLIIIALGVSLGHVGKEILSLVTVVGLITIAGSTYLILHANSIYLRISPFLSIFERKGRKVDEHKYNEYETYDIILFGYNRIGYDLLRSFKKLKRKFLIIDYNPETIISLAKQGVECRYGDASDSELLGELNLHKAKMVFSTIPDYDINAMLIARIRKRNKKSIIFVVSHQIDEALSLYSQGASYVIMPHFLGGHHASLLIERCRFNLRKILKENAAHRKRLEGRKKIGHEHPKHERH